jgi:hypothetical protein
MSNTKHVDIKLPNGTLASCRPCTCGAENNLVKPHIRSCELYTDYSAALTDELVFGEGDTAPGSPRH